MKSHILRLSLLGSVLGALTLNVALADEVAYHDFKNGGIVVSYHDLNLSKAAGVESLKRRVDSAANRMCGVENFRVSLDIVRKNQECVSWLTDKAILRIGDERITAFEESKIAARITASLGS